MTIVEKIKKEVAVEREAESLVWTIYCLDCEKVIDKAVNGALMEAGAKIHTVTTGHKVILGNVFKLKKD